jgi:signal transduction histidine kinase
MISVLYAEDEPLIASVMRSYLNRFAPECTLEVVATGRACLERMQQGGFDVLILDLMLPDIDGLHILGELAGRGDPTPVIMVSGHGQTELAVRALRAGAVDCIDKTTGQFLQLPEIIKRVHARHREQSTRPLAPVAARPDQYRVMLIEVSIQVRDTLTGFFKTNAPQLGVTTANSSSEFDRLLLEEKPFDAVIIGPNPGTLDALDVLRQLRSRARETPVLMISGQSDGETAVAAFKLGAQDFILLKENYLPEVVFSINNILRQTDTERRNVQLSRELAELNRSLEAQVAARTGELQAEVRTRQQAEHRAEEHAARQQTLSKRLIKIQEDERRAIARELHDQVGQMLTGLKFQLEAAVQAASPANREQLVESLGIATDLLRHVRELTQQFRPRILDDLGLRPALEWHADLFHRQTGIKVELEVSTPPQRLPVELETAVFRVVQEALTNIARHAGCTAATVTVTTADHKLLAEITDRGRGFDLDAVLASRDSIGLTGLAERVNLAGGQLEIFSRAGQGTRIHAEFPLPSDPPASASPA